MNILITGGTGLIGKAIIRSLRMDGHSVWVLTRREPERYPVTDGFTYVNWDGLTTLGWGSLVSEMDAILNLAGEPLAKWPWSRKQKARFRESRVKAGQAITQSIRAASPRPKVLIQASGINHYGLKGDPSDEFTPPGDDFLSKLTLDWEDSTREVEQMGVRRCTVRLAVVLTSQGGLFRLMSLPVKLFVGGRLGSGKQAVPWVSLEDVVRAIRFLLDNEHTSGVYNLVAPETISNESFYRVLAKVFHRPYWFPAPAFFLKAFLGEMSVLVLDGRAATPTRLLASGFSFQFNEIRELIDHIV